MPGGDFVQQLFQTSADERYRVIGNTRWISLPDWDAYDDELLRTMDGDAILASGTISSYEKEFGYWYKSREPIE